MGKVGLTNPATGCRGTGYVELAGPRHDIQTAGVAGAAVTVLAGELTIWV